MHTDIIKDFFADLMSVDKAIMKGDSEDLKFVINLIKIMTEDAELFQRLPTNEPLN